MSTVIVRDGDAVLKDPSDIKVYPFDWDTESLAALVTITASKFKLRGVNAVGQQLLVTISTITRTGGTATVTTAAAHGYSTGDSITIDGAVQDDYNGTFTITKIDATSFSYSVANTPATPATATSDGLTAVAGFDSVSIGAQDKVIVTATGSVTLHANRYTQFRFTGGVVGAIYEISNRITTNESPAQTIERSFLLKIEDL